MVKSSIRFMNKMIMHYPLSIKMFKMASHRGLGDKQPNGFGLKSTALPMATRHILIGFTIETKGFIIMEAMGSAYHRSGRI